MKKTLLIFFAFILVGFGAYTFRNKIITAYHDLARTVHPTALQVASSTERIFAKASANFAKHVSTPPPLRAGVPSAPAATLTPNGVISATNKERAKAGLATLGQNSELTAAAVAKVKDMFDKQYFEHISPSGVGVEGLAIQAGYEYIEIGENLAEGNFASDADLVTAWMNSPGHRANILNTHFAEIGVAVGQGMFEGHRVWLAVQHFGRPLSACPAPNKSAHTEINSGEAALANQEASLKTQQAALEQTEEKNTPEYRQKVAEYNQLVTDHNTLVEKLKKLITDYNASVAAFNACVAE